MPMTYAQKLSNVALAKTALKNYLASPESKCSVCLKTAEKAGIVALQVCKNCLTPYCSKECQTLDWKTHKLSCRENVGEELSKALQSACLLPKREREVTLTELNLELLDKNHFNTAIDFIQRHIVQEEMRNQAFQSYCDKILINVSSLVSVLEVAPSIQDRKLIGNTVVSALCKNGHIERAIEFAQSKKDTREALTLLKQIRNFLIEKGDLEKANYLKELIKSRDNAPKS